MPHFGLIPEGLSKKDELVMRSKLHYRGGTVRLERGQIADAIASFYDAVSSAMMAAFIEVAGSKSTEKLRSYDDRDIFLELKRANRIDGTFTSAEFDYISNISEQALESILDDFEAARFVPAVEKVLRLLGVLPIEDGELPEAQSETL